MIILEWNGEIGWELWTGRIKGDLKSNSGEDLTIRFSSIGGDIFDGADMMVLLANHKKDNPGIKMNLELGGVAASMGSAIAASPVWDTISVEPLTAHMIHRPSSFVYGDFDDMRARADFLEKANNVYAKLYADKSGQSLSEIQTQMKDTTWLFGQEIVDAGFADSVVESDQTGDKDMIITGMKNKFSKMCENQTKLHEGESLDIVKAAACFKIDMSTTNTNTTGKPEIIKPTSVGNSNMEVPMNEEELAKFKKDNPEAYQAMMKEGRDQEKTANSERVKLLTEMKKDDDYKDFPEVLEVIDNAIMNGGTTETVTPKINIAIMKIMKDPARMSAIESPGDISGGDSKPESETETIGEV